MKKYISIAASLFLFLGLATPVFAQVSRAPVSIYSLSPTSGPVGTQVTIKGFGFTSSGNTITANGRYFANNLVSSDGATLQFTIPSETGYSCPPPLACPMYLIQVTPGNYPITVINANGTSNAVTFTVTNSNSITVLSPNGGEQWAQGSTQTIRWSAPSSVSAVTISISEYFSCWYTSPACMVPVRILPPIASNVPNTGSYSWTIPNTLLSQYKISVSDAGNSGLFDTSDAPFTIVSGTTSNQPPVISSVGGPVSLNVWETGTWTVKASDPDGAYLNYSVDWGDMPNYTAGSIAPIPAPATQTSTFTHSYSQAGNYKVVFTVSDNAGGSAQSSLTVTVGQTQTPIVLTEGSLFQISGQPTVYLVIGGVLRPFTSAVVFLARGLLWSNVRQVTSGQISAQLISSLPVLLPDGSLMKGSSPTVFIVLGGKKYGIPSLEIFNRLGLSFKNVLIISDGDVQGYPDGGIQY